MTKSAASSRQDRAPGAAGQSRSRAQKYNVHTDGCTLRDEQLYTHRYMHTLYAFRLFLVSSYVNEDHPQRLNTPRVNSL